VRVKTQLRFTSDEIFRIRDTDRDGEVNALGRQQTSQLSLHPCRFRCTFYDLCPVTAPCR
jgi:hypothetical protein